MIEVSELTAGYGTKQVISRFSFSLSPEQMPLVLAGPNGSGKSTIFRCILKQIPYQGKIILPWENEGIAWLPQGFQLPISIPVTDFVALGALKPGKLRLQAGGAEMERARSELEGLEMGHLAGKNTDELSGGEWQLACLAQMAMQNPGIWLLDEPTAHLDLYFKNLVFQYLWKKAGEGKCMVLSTHDIPFLPERGGTFLMMTGRQRLIEINPESKKAIAERLQTGPFL